MEVRKLIEEYLKKANMMQVATSANNQPWACTVYFANDNDLNLYWMSLPTRRHSKEIAENKKVAGVIVLPHTPGDKVRGLQFEGVADEITDNAVLETTYPFYGKKYNRMDSLPRMLSGENKHRYYRIQPTSFVLFDDLNFPNEPRQEYKIR